MFKNILVPTDGSLLSIRAIDGAIEYARLVDARLIGLSVIEPYPDFLIGEAAGLAEPPLVELSEKFAKDNIDAFVKRVLSAAIRYETVLVTDPNPWSAIVKVAESKMCDAIFMASHGRRGINALVLGSETNKVLTHTRLPVLVYR